MLKVAVTGSAGSGKTIVCSRFEESGFHVIGADTLAREAVRPGSRIFSAVIERFGKRILNPDGSLNRQRLRDRILQSPSDRKALEQLIHPEVLRKMNIEMAKLKSEGADLVLVEVPLLFEAGFEGHFDIIISVSADDEIKAGRIMSRDRVTRDSALSLLGSQMPDDEKVNRSDYVLLNNGSRKQLVQEVDRLIKELKQKITKTA